MGSTEKLVNDYDHSTKPAPEWDARLRIRAAERGTFVIEGPGYD